MSNYNFSTRAALFASPVNSPSSKNSNLVSPDVVPKKKVAREKPLPPPVFVKMDAPEASEDVEDVPEASEDVEDVPEAPKVSEDVPEEEKPMEIDTSNMPSPQKATPRRQASATSSALNAAEAVKLDKLYEKLMKETEKMTASHEKVRKEMSDLLDARKYREEMIKEAEEFVKSGHISSETQEPIAMSMDLDFSIRKVDLDVTVREEEEKPEDTVRRLFGNYLLISGGGDKKAKMKLEQSEKKNEKLGPKLFQAPLGGPFYSAVNIFKTPLDFGRTGKTRRDIKKLQTPFDSQSKITPGYKVSGI
ncbi:hypothetical protein B9Z55_017185 [Caenorhabditis nigoni]|uniref:Uncharacterized protein n=1 Tax=Caenorhabditis nigoni TaxID=1611254 RepID=A0A2G5T8A5_9PELO|nr:hypothetical protein B9Z55_017185 [Caenorhabditis nigoni]